MKSFVSILLIIAVTLSLGFAVYANGNQFAYDKDGVPLRDQSCTILQSTLGHEYAYDQDGEPLRDQTCLV